MSVADPWLLHDDRIVDPVALDVAAKGTRPVRLTARERTLAALIALSQHQYCLCHEGPNDPSIIDLLWVNLSLPSREAAQALLSSLPRGWEATRLVRYWTDTSYRQREVKRVTAAKSRRQPVAA